jgi:methylenetetrahydrofolate reductase (NADPH)
MLAIVRGLGYDGAHIGGTSARCEDVEFVIQRAELYASRWEELMEEVNYAPSDTFYLYPRDQAQPVNRYERQETPSLAYRAMRGIHNLAFTQNAPLYRNGVWFYRRYKDTFLDRVFTEIEYDIKAVTSRCQRCGDCTLAEVAYLCPQSQCPKFQLNGPCGGSQDGWCEVYPGERRCLYVRAYQRLKPEQEDGSLKQHFIAARNWALNRTSSWKNYFMGLDHLKGQR